MFKKMKIKIIILFLIIASTSVIAYRIYKKSKERVVYKVGNFEIIKVED